MSNPDTPQAQAPLLVDDPNISEVFADSIAGMSITLGHLNLTFATIRVDYTRLAAARHRKVPGRVVLPLTVAAELHSLLGQLLSEVEKGKTGANTGAAPHRSQPSIG